MDSLELTKQQMLIGEQIIKEIKARVGFLADVGLDYLTLSRATGTLSGGEAQRIRLATQIGSGLVGVAYILDEPSIGLHQRDNDKLLATLKHLRDLGNSLIVVEHDEDTMLAADCVVDIGPGAGEHGGELVGIGTWTKPLGGYFISFDAMEGCAKAIVAKAKEAGLVMTGAGATYPYGNDPKDSNIRIAPSYPTPDELAVAGKVFVLSVKLVSVDKLLQEA